MFTQCPHCNHAFRVTAPDLTRASGRVFCAGCSREFNALEKLTEDPPAVAGGAEDPDSLIQTLAELTGEHEIRIEDTGIEWRVIDEDEGDEEESVDDPVTPAGELTVEGESPGADGEVERPHIPANEDSGSTSSVRWYLDDPADEPVEDAEAVPDTTSQEPVEEDAAVQNDADGGSDSEHVSNDAEPAAHFDLDVQRYDDNTPLPDDYEEEEEPQVFTRRAEDRVEPRAPEADEAQADLALGEPDDWMDLLDEVAQRNEAAASGHDSRAEAAPSDVPLQIAAAEGEACELSPSTFAPEAPGEDALAETDIGALAEDREDDEELIVEDLPADIDTQFDLQALEMGIDLTGSRNLTLEEEPGEEQPELEQRPTEEVKAAGNESPSIGAPPVQEVGATAFENELELEGDEQNQATDYSPEGEDSEEAEARRREEAFEQELAAAWAASAGEVQPDAPTTGKTAPPDEPAPVTRENDSSETGDGAGDPEHYVPPQTEEEMTINMLIDQDLIKLAEQEGAFTSTRAHSRLDEAPHVETIIMEGDFVRNALEAELASTPGGNGEHVLNEAEGDPSAPKSGVADSPNDQHDILDTHVKSTDIMRGGRRRTDPASYRVIAGVAALVLVLAAQVVHAWRDSLATYPMFDRTIGSVYRLLGEPLNPDWDIREWQFETTSGRTDDTDNVLTISSRLANGASRPLPYPLLHVSLTDRWEEIIGSKILEPGDYLEGKTDSAARVPPGDRFTALVRVEAPSPEATGFKLNVCYREPGNRVRCATQDFKD
ncbi:MAG TPA: zinc-ribbon and DUF3426 domain-containing protein [Woeseiaceae bacterium]|nr:zinc-ribbon and DUF3426 domain-containing protein [Woeseiaceae bacterium]